MLDRPQTWCNGIHTKYNYVALVQGHLVKSFWLNSKTILDLRRLILQSQGQTTDERGYCPLRTHLCFLCTLKQKADLIKYCHMENTYDNFQYISCWLFVVYDAN